LAARRRWLGNGCCFDEVEEERCAERIAAEQGLETFAKVSLPRRPWGEVSAYGAG